MDNIVNSLVWDLWLKDPSLHIKRPFFSLILVAGSTLQHYDFTFLCIFPESTPDRRVNYSLTNNFVLIIYFTLDGWT